MSEIIHEGKKYEAKDIPGFGLSFVPVKENLWKELAKLYDGREIFVKFKIWETAGSKEREFLIIKDTELGYALMFGNTGIDKGFFVNHVYTSWYANLSELINQIKGGFSIELRKVK